jgi:hypothetical protein
MFSFSLFCSYFSLVHDSKNSEILKMPVSKNVQTKKIKFEKYADSTNVEMI